MPRNKIMTDLAVNIRTQMAEFKKGMKQASNSVRTFANNAKRAGQDFKRGFSNAFSSIGATINPQLAIFGNMLSGATSGMRTLTAGTKAWKVALASTGIGLLVVALGSLVTWLTKTKEGMRIVTIATEVLQTVFTIIIDRVAKLGGALVKLLRGDFKGAFNDAKEAVTGFGEELVSKSKEAVSIGKADVKLQEERIKRDKIIGELAAKNGELRKKARDIEKYSAQERVKFTQQELANLEEINRLKISTLDDEIDLLKRRQDQGENTLEDDQELADLMRQRGVLQGQFLKQEKEVLMLRDSINKEAIKEVEAQEKLNKQIEDQYNLIQQIDQIKRKGVGDKPEQGDPETDFAKHREQTDKLLEDSKRRVEELGIEQDAWGSFSDFISSSVGGAFKTMSDVIAASLSNGKNVLQSFLEFFKRWALGLIVKMTSMIVTALVLTALLSALGLGGFGGIASAKSAMGFGNALTANLKSLSGFASGGISPGGIATVGEHGPETVFLPKNTRVLSHRDSMNALSNNITRMPQEIRVTGVIEGDGEKLRVVIQEANRKANNSRG